MGRLFVLLTASWATLSLAAPRPLTDDGRVVLVEGETGWPEPLVHALKAALATLPAPLQAFPGGVLELQLHDAALPFGVGDGSADRPDWTEGRRRFHLYALADAAEPRVERRLQGLSPDERHTLLRRRALVHAVMQRWDDAHRFSQRRAWRRLNGWLMPFDTPFTFRERALNTYVGAYSRARGQASAALDWVTFAEELLAPIESVSAAPIPADRRVVCEELSKTRVMRGQLEALGVAWPPVRCEAFEAWAQLDELSHHEVLLVAASGRQPESLFGHILLRPVHHATDRVRGPGFQTAVQVAAITDDPTIGVPYLVRGVFGGYSTAVFTLTMGDLSREVLQSEQRTIRRFRLNLTPAQGRHVLERVWDLERRGYYAYRFFTDNCASVLVHLLEGALDEDARVVLAGVSLVSPTSALDALARVKLERPGAHGGRETVALLTPLLDELESARQRAERAEAQRRRLEEKLSAQDEALGPLFQQARAASPDARRAAFEALGARWSGRAHEADLFDWWMLSVAVERYAVEQAETERLTLEAKVIERDPAHARSPALEVQQRQALFEDDVTLASGRMVLDRAEEERERLLSAPRRRYTAEELKALVQAQRVEATFERLVELQGELLTHRPSGDGRRWLERERAERIAAKRALDRDALLASGSWRLSVGLAALRDHGGATTSALALHTALLSEQLGDQRIHGFQPTAELRVLDAVAYFRPQLGLPQLERSDLTLFAYRSVLREPPMQRADVLDALGWGFALSTHARPHRALHQRSQLMGELLVLADESARARRFTTLGLGAVTWVDWNARALSPAVGPRASLAARLPLPAHSANAVKLEAGYAAAWQWGRGLRQELKAQATLEWLFGSVASKAAMARPAAWVEAGWDRLGLEATASGGLWVEAL